MLNWKLILPFLIVSLSFGQENNQGQKFHTEKGFIENKGQFDGRNWRSDAPILYSVSYNPFNIYFAKDGWTYRFDKLIKNPLIKTNPQATPRRLNISELVQVRWVNSNPNVEVIADAKQKPYFTYGIMTANKTESAIEGIHSYEKITYKNLYKNIDVEYVIHPEGGVKYNVILHPGANLSDLKLRYSLAHTETQDEAISIRLNDRGQMEISTSLGSVVEHAPVSFYDDGEPIQSSFNFDGEHLTFDLVNYDNSRKAIIDPWIITPNFQTSTAVWEVETDAVGNVYSIGGETPMELKKYDINGALQWTYVTPWDTNTVWLGTLATDPAGNSFVTSGTNPTIQRVNTAGGLVYSVNHSAISGPAEFWSITFNCDYSKLIVGGTHSVVSGLGFVYSGAIFDMDINNGSILNTQLFEEISIGATPPTGIFLPTPIEVRSIASSKNSQYTYLTHTKVGKITDNFTFCGDNAPIFDVDNQKNLGYKCENFLPATQNGGGLKGIIAGDDYFYTHSGDEIRQWDILTGALVNTVNLPGGSSNTVPLVGGHVMHCSGLTVDDCGNIYAGSMNQVVQFDENLNILNSQSTTFAVYDVAVNSNGEVIACGAQQNNSATNRNGRIESINFNACDQLALICCDANFCNPGPLCETDAAVTMEVSSPGGTWSGVGVNAAGVFDPAIAGVGEHIITYTLACGEVQQTVLVSPCQPLEACVNADGSITITNGVGTIVWEEDVPPSSSPITNETECTNCGYTWLPAIPFISPAQCLDGLTVVTSCNDPGGLTQFATGVTVMPGPNFPLVVTDGAGYQITINDINDLDDCVTVPCTNLTVTITNQSDISCNGASDGSATVTATGGNGSYTYTWSPGALNGPTQNGLTAGSYTVDVIDSDGCEGSVVITITEPAEISLSTVVTNAECGVPDGAIDLTVVGGAVPYTYAWSNGAATQNISGLTPGSYSVNVTDANGCVANITATVAATDGPDISLVSSSDVSCFGLSDGAAQVDASGGSGGYVFQWQPGGLNGANQSNLSAGSYTVTVTDSDGCPASLVVEINSPDEIQLNLSSTASSCTVDDGTLSAVASGGDGNFSYLWSNGATTASVNDVGPGVYTLTVTDGQGCQSEGTVTVGTVNGPAVSITNIIDETCLGSGDGSATANVTGGTPGYTYVWSPSGGSNVTATDLTSGTYTVTVTDDAGCVAFGSVTIESGNIEVEIVPDVVSIDNGDEVILDVVIDPASSGVSYTWAPSEGLSCDDCQNPIASPSQTTVYTVTVVTDQGCSASASTTIFVNAPCNEAMLPAMFSPNGDGNNDAFCVLGNCVQSMELTIYNRWGEVMFESSSQSNCWDGTHRDKPVNSGSYVYKLRVINTDGQEEITTGNVTLVR